MHGFAPAPPSNDRALARVHSTWRRVDGLRMHARVSAALELSRVARPFLLEAARAGPHGMETAR